jgi:ankyrin repeat protein
VKSQLIAIVAALLVVGCGQSDHQHSHDDGHSHAEGDHHHAEGDIDDHDKELKAAEPVAEAAKPKPPTAKAPDISIHDAAGEGNIEAVKQHIAAGTDVDAKLAHDPGGITPLLVAAASGHKELAELLIANGADVNATDDGGKTPLDWAFGYLKLETIDLLRKHGGKSGVEDSIIAAASLGNVNAVKDHLAAGTDVNTKDDRGRTPLHWAAYDGRNKIAELLITAGADVNANSDNGTPLDTAISRKHPETTDLLRKHGGKTSEELKAEGK